MKLKIIYLLFTFAITVMSQTNLSGNVGGMTLEKSGNPFIVGENVTIPAGKKFSMPEGRVFLSSNRSREVLFK